MSKNGATFVKQSYFDNNQCVHTKRNVYNLIFSEYKLIAFCTYEIYDLKFALHAVMAGKQKKHGAIFVILCVFANFACANCTQLGSAN